MKSIVPVCIAAALAACTPLRHTIEPYASDAEQARALEERAIASCAPLRAGVLPTHAFTTDGCSMWPDGDWVACCIEHDFAYWCGGDASLRLAADDALRRCVRRLGHEQMAPWMYLGVRAGGAAWLPFPWRWGYGWDWPHRNE